MFALSTVGAADANPVARELAAQGAAPALAAAPASRILGAR